MRAGHGRASSSSAAPMRISDSSRWVCCRIRGSCSDGRPGTPRVRRGGRRRRRRGVTRGDRGPHPRGEDCDRVQVASRQGAHGHGRGRHRRGARERVARGQLEGALPRHHAWREAPDRVLELEEWGALFDRTKDGLILQRDFGGHRYARLAHVGDRTGLEMIRTLQDHAVANGIDVFMECTLRHLLSDGDRVTGAIGYWRQSGELIAFAAKAVVLATGGVGKAWRVTSNSWEYTGDGFAMALEAGADLIDMEMTQFHPTGMIWPPSVRGLLVTEGVRGDGGTLRNASGGPFRFKYS